MTPPQWASVVGLAVVAGALAGGVVAHRMTPPSASSALNVTAEAAPELSSRVEALERAVSRLERTPRTTITLPTAMPSGAAAPGQAASAVAPGAPVVDDPVFEVAVRDVVQRLEEEREAERQVQRQEQRQAAAERWASGLVERLHLNEQQKAKLQQIARDFYDQVREALASPDAGAALSGSERRAKVQSLREASEQKLGQVLDGSQLSEYRKLDDEDKLGARGAPRGGAPRGGP